MKNLLILSPRFAPVSSADNQRVLQMIPYLAEAGWRVHVAAVDCTGMGLPEDVALLARVAANSRWRYAQPAHSRVLHWLGIRSLGFRARAALNRMVAAWHAEVGFDLVFVSNTEFGLWPLALRWKQKFGIPFVLDWQDPWWSDYYRLRPERRPPGGRLKFAVVQALARWQEPGVAKAAAAHVCVSSHYVRMLRTRYPEIAESRFAVIPFSSSAHVIDDDAVISSKSIERYWAYAGRGGEDMQFALTALFRALATERQRAPERFVGLRLKFIGTSYADAARAVPSILPIASACGVADIVDEQTQRVPPAEVHRFLMGAEALIVPGSDDPGYVASKIQSYLAYSKPMLAIFHAQSDVAAVLAGQAGVVACTFADTSALTADAFSAAIADRWMSQSWSTMATQPRFNSAHEPKVMTEKLGAVFHSSIEAAST